MRESRASERDGGEAGFKRGEMGERGREGESDKRRVNKDGE